MPSGVYLTFFGSFVFGELMEANEAGGKMVVVHG
jgi:hypothetical protein